MRRHRYARGGYRAGNVKKSRKKLIIKIAFVLACAILLTVFSVLLGFHLKRKADESVNLSTDTDTAESTSAALQDLFPSGVPVKDPEAAKNELCAAYIDITSADAETLTGMIDELSADYNAVSVRISAEDGKLVYISPALMEYAGLDTALIPKTEIEPDSDDDTAESYDVFENLRAVLSKAKSEGLRTVAVFTADSTSLDYSVDALSKCELDSVVAGELASLGCDEILIEGLFAGEGQMPHETQSAIVSYLAAIRRRSGETLLGLSFPDAVYLIPQNASAVKTLSAFADFLAISVSTGLTDPDEAYSAIYDSYYSLKGNFSMYGLRAVIDVSDEGLAAAVRASLASLSARSFQFTLYAPDIAYSATKNEVLTDTDAEIGEANPNANRADDYEQTEEPIQGAE